MTLRTKLLALLTLLAAGPLLAIGVIGYVLSVDAVADQLESLTRPISERSAQEIAKGVAQIESDLGLLAGNSETTSLLELLASASEIDSVGLGSARASADSFFTAVWGLFAPSYASVELRQAGGGTVIARRSEGGAAFEGTADLDGSGLVEYEVSSATEGGRSVGSVRALVRLEPLLGSDVFEARLGERGVSAVVDRRNGRMLRFADETGRSVVTLEEAGLAELEPALADSGAVRLGTGSARRVGWVTPVRSLPWTVVALSDLDEFQGPFRRQRLALSLIVLALAITVVPAGVVLLKGATRSLDELTTAADRVGRGDFEPPLPAAGRDEVGRLSAAFQTMVSEVKRMMAEIERSQQLAAVGAFATELSHEIRNPLTAIKLNLQRLERMVEAGEIPTRGERPVSLALQEIGRLDRVVRSALKLGRTDVGLEKRTLSLAQVLERALALVRPQLAEAGIHLHVEGDDVLVDADEEALAGALVNLLLNAVQAMPRGGDLRVRTVTLPGVPWVDVHVADTGEGIPESVQGCLFRPFVTTRKDGTGLGLALSLRTVEAHGGTITLLRTSAAGTEFRVRLPLVAARASS